MKRTVFICLIALLFSGLIHGQCTYKEIFPVEHGISKFKATTALAAARIIIKDEQSNKYSLAYWDKPDYLNGDSVYKSTIHYDYSFHPCFEGNENELQLSFVDDMLYKIETTVVYSNTQFNECIANYNKLVEILKVQFPYWEEFQSKTVDTQEQLGEGLWFTRVPEHELDELKIEVLSIGYEIEYEREWSDYKKEWYRTGNVVSYKIEIQFVDLRGTKLTGEGF